jgi:hypothetical protein
MTMLSFISRAEGCDRFSISAGKDSKNGQMDKLRN